jgi:hypothetical protein
MATRTVIAIAHIDVQVWQINTDSIPMEASGRSRLLKQKEPQPACVRPRSHDACALTAFAELDASSISSVRLRAALAKCGRKCIRHA